MKIVITVEVPDGADVAVGTSESVAPSKAKAKKVAAPESVSQAAPVVAAAASAPAPAEPVTAPATPTFPNLIKDVNPIVSKLAGKDRDAALKILLAHGAKSDKTSTSQLKPEVYQAVIDETEEAIALFDAASVKAANSGSLV